MKTIQMTLDEDLIEELDGAVKKMGTSRSAFTRQALRAALSRLREMEMEERDIAGYREKPIQADEFSDWENEQIWAEK